MIHVRDYRWESDGFVVEWSDDRQNGMVGYTHVTKEWVESIVDDMLRPMGGPSREFVQIRNVLRDGFQEEDLPVVVAWWRQHYEQVVYDRLDAGQMRGRELADYMRERRGR